MTPHDDDPYLWLEEVQGDRALAWVHERNAECVGQLTAQSPYAPIRQQLLAVLNSTERIAQVSRRGAWFYNLWRDETHPRGLWRRTTWAAYRKSNPDWETVLDIDALAAAEGENWVWAGADTLGTAPHRCLVSLSRGGADAVVVREFDTTTKQFVADGFVLPEAKSTLTWIDANTLYVGTDVGSSSLTASGYPRTIRRWQRGTPLAAAELVFEGAPSDVSVSVSTHLTPGHERTLFSRSLDFYHQQHFLLCDGMLVPFDVPRDASFSFWNHAGAPDDTLLIELRSNWVVAGTTYVGGSLLACGAHAYLAGTREFTVLFSPTDTCSLAGYSTTREHLLLNLLDNVASRLVLWRRQPDGSFEPRPINAPFPGTLSVRSLRDPMDAADPLAEHYLLGYTDFLTPDSLFVGHTQATSNALELLKARPALFNASGLRAEQRFARSADGTRVPYFVIGPRAVRADGRNPTLLYGYGGFEVTLNPWYSGTYGQAWFERGGTLVVANLRGGGEFGPAWHQAALREHKQRSYDDFIAVATDLIDSGLTRPQHLGIMGGSNGGLLVGAAFTQRPELFNAVVCQVPLLDMRRYHRLLAGASWMAEYGNPDLPDDWAHIARYSPYQNLSPDRTYPEVLLTTSTRDDRVHPAHARKMAARMRELGHRVLYYENTEGGHGGAADNTQRAHLQALEFAYLWRQLGRAD